MEGPRREAAELGTVLGIWAHPDDEAYLSGGLMALARDQGSRVVCVTATYGELGTPDPTTWPPDRLAATRQRELARSLEVLGVTEHRWLGHRDGECADVPRAVAVEQLCEVIVEVQPDTVLTFGPDGITGHPDHQAVSGWAAAAFERAGGIEARLLFAAISDRRERRWVEVEAELGVYQPGYPVITPVDELALHLWLDEATLERKVRALSAQETQTAGLIAAMGRADYAAWVSEEAFAASRRPDR